MPSARSPAAIGGRFGPRRTTSSRVYSTRTGRPCSSARRRATAPTSVATLPPNAPPLASGVAGSPPGAHHEASGSRYPGSTHVVCNVRCHSPGGSSTGQEQRRGRPPALHRAGQPPGLRQRLADVPLARPPRAPRRGPRRREVVGEPGPTERRRRADQLGRPTFEECPSGAREVGSVLRFRPDRAGIEGQHGLHDRLPAGAAAQVGGEGAVDGRR